MTCTVLEVGFLEKCWWGVGRMEGREGREGDRRREEGVGIVREGRKARRVKTEILRGISQFLPANLARPVFRVFYTGARRVRRCCSSASFPPLHLLPLLSVPSPSFRTCTLFFGRGFLEKFLWKEWGLLIALNHRYERDGVTDLLFSCSFPHHNHFSSSLHCFIVKVLSEDSSLWYLRLVDWLTDMKCDTPEVEPYSQSLTLL